MCNDLKMTHHISFINPQQSQRLNAIGKIKRLFESKETKRTKLRALKGKQPMRFTAIDDLSSSSNNGTTRHFIRD